MDESNETIEELNIEILLKHNPQLRKYIENVRKEAHNQGYLTGFQAGRRSI